MAENTPGNEIGVPPSDPRDGYDILDLRQEIVQQTPTGDLSGVTSRGLVQPFTKDPLEGTVGPKGTPFRRDTRPVPGIFIDMETGDYREFAMNPTSVVERMGATWADQNALGVSHPHIQYTGGEPHTMKFTLYWNRAMAGMSRRDIELDLRWLDHFLHPQRNATGLVRSPPRIQFYYGPRWLDWECVMTEMSVRTLAQARDTLKMGEAECEVTLKRLVDRSLNSEEFWSPGQDRWGNVVEADSLLTEVGNAAQAMFNWATTSSGATFNEITEGVVDYVNRALETQGG